MTIYHQWLVTNSTELGINEFALIEYHIHLLMEFFVDDLQVFQLSHAFVYMSHPDRFTGSILIVPLQIPFQCPLFSINAMSLLIYYIFKLDIEFIGASEYHLILREECLQLLFSQLQNITELESCFIYTNW
jgi:hypothetical protein